MALMTRMRRNETEANEVNEGRKGSVSLDSSFSSLASVDQLTSATFASSAVVPPSSRARGQVKGGSGQRCPEQICDSVSDTFVSPPLFP